MKVHGIGDILRLYRPRVLFLSETKGTTCTIEKRKRQWNMLGVAIDREGMSDGLALLWRKDVKVGPFELFQKSY